MSHSKAMTLSWLFSAVTSDEQLSGAIYICPNIFKYTGNMYNTFHQSFQSSKQKQFKLFLVWGKALTKHMVPEKTPPCSTVVVKLDWISLVGVLYRCLRRLYQSHLYVDLHLKLEIVLTFVFE